MANARRASAVAAILLPLLLSEAVLAASACKLTPLAQLPVTMQGRQPMVPAKINGQDVKFLVDSGAFYSILSPASAQALELPRTMAPAGFVLKGVGGDAHPTLATVRDFGLAGGVVNNMEFLVAGGSFGEAVGVLGQNVLNFADAEYDLGGGAVRLIRAEKCKDAERLYWMKPGEKFSSVAIQPVDRMRSQLVGTALLNGKRIRVLFDTGASGSLLSLRAAERAGVKTTSEGVVPAGRIRGGGTGVVETWIAPFASFRIGEEEIRNTRLRIGDVDFGDADMLVGADFFLSHRVYVSLGQNKVLFTYRGGPVFDVGGGNAESVAAPGEVAAELREPVDAQGFSRRAAVYAARQDLARAIADLTRAIELDAAEPEYLHQRGRLRMQNRQPAEALQDLDRAIALKPDVPGPRVTRAAMLLTRLQATGNGSTAQITADLDVARSLAARESDLHLELGSLYAGVGEQERARDEFDLWASLHRNDARAVEARAMACRARAVLGQELDRALDECNTAARDRPGSPVVLEARGLVHLRLDNFDRAIQDFDKVLAEQPRNVWALYGRGLAKHGKGQAAAGDADINAAKGINPRIVSNAVARGFVP